MKKKIYSVVYVLCLVVSFFVLSSCELNNAVGISNAEINENGELVILYSNGTEQNLGVVVGKDGADGESGTLILDSDANNISVASSKGLRSAVSIVCNFQATVQQGGWRPGSGGTMTKSYSTAGSGVIYRMDKSEGDAFIITNYHVVYDASSNTENGISNDISVYLYGSEIEGKGIKAAYVGGSLYYDIAILRIEDSEILKTSSACGVDVADSDKVVPGDGAIAIGNAKGLGISSTSGVVSVDSEHITMTAADEKTRVAFRVMRVDTAINSGNSGGGLYNDDGKLIGIVNAKIVYDGVENIGYAIPSNVAVSVAENVIDYCYGTDSERVQRAWFGITVTSSDSKAVFDSSTGLVTIGETVSVYEVGNGSLADGVLQDEDIIISAVVNGKTTKITRQHQIIEMMLDVRVGDVVTLNIIRGGEEMVVSMTITDECLVAY